MGTNSGAFPEEHIPDSRPGRKPVPARAILEAVLWILNTGAQWHMLPQYYPNYKTVHRRFQQWCQREVLRAVLTQLANTLREEGAIDERESFIDATFAAAKGGGADIGPTRRGKGVKILAIVDCHGLPLSVSTHAANHHEVTLVQLSFDFYMLEAKPEHLIGDRAYDSDGLDDALKLSAAFDIPDHNAEKGLQSRLCLVLFINYWLVEQGVKGLLVPAIFIRDPHLFEVGERFETFNNLLKVRAWEMALFFV